MKLWLTEAQVCQFAETTPEAVQSAAKDKDPAHEVLVTRKLDGTPGLVYDIASVCSVFMKDASTVLVACGFAEWPEGVYMTEAGLPPAKEPTK